MHNYSDIFLAGIAVISGLSLLIGVVMLIASLSVVGLHLVEEKSENATPMLKAACGMLFAVMAIVIGLGLYAIIHVIQSKP